MGNSKEYYKKLVRRYIIDYKVDYINYLSERYRKYKYICGFSVGNMGSCVPTFVEAFGRKLDFFCDNDIKKTGKKDPYGYNIDVISVEELEKYKKDTVVLVPTRYYKEIYAQLSKDGFPLVDRIFPNKVWIDEFLDNHDKKNIAENLCRVIDLLEDEESCRIVARLIQEWTRNEYVYGQLDDIYSIPQYFPKDIIGTNEREIFVDCGAYIGDIVPDFIKFVEGKFERYYAFELNIENYNKLQEQINEKWSADRKKFVLENKGVSDKTGAIWYSSNGEGSRISNTGTSRGQTIALDDYFELGKQATFIKMEIEGAEVQALYGARKLIDTQHPKLAICIYHKPEDMWKIPLLIKELYPQYKLYIRHHTDLFNETVCYAV